MRAHARIRIRCERVQCEHMRMRAFASHCMRTHLSCVMRAFAYVIWASSVSVMRAYARIRIRCERIRIACARIRIACARIACECAHLRGTYACPVLYNPAIFMRDVTNSLHSTTAILMAIFSHHSKGRASWDSLVPVTHWNKMTSSNGNIFRVVAGHLCGEFTGHRWIPRTKASDDAELWYFLWSAPESTVE